jgi:hypothetical protein
LTKIASRWNGLLERQKFLEKSSEFSSTDHLDVVQRLGALRLVQPFDWNACGAIVFLTVFQVVFFKRRRWI